MKYAAIGPIAVHFPQRVETNEMLGAEFPNWPIEAIESKTGIRQRYIAERDECASDLACHAAERLFRDYGVERSSIDFLLLCTQTPDYPLPTTACLLQDRLGLPTQIGALDFNLGCSGFVYGLSLADGLIRGGSVRRVLLITAETYSKYIAAEDRSLRTIFSDAAAATLVDAADQPSLAGFIFGTDGAGADTLMVNRGGARPPEHALQPRNRWRWPSQLYMDGPSLVSYTVEAIPKLVDDVLRAGQARREEIDYFLMHQATRKMLDHLREALDVEERRFPIRLEEVGNTVSGTLPILMQQMRESREVLPGIHSMLVGFGVGYSSAGCLWRETWDEQHRQWATPAG